jgi:V/A-type H+-transporting ATPase subunit G/H
VVKLLAVDEALKKIREAEEAAEDIIRHASIKARETVRSASEKAENDYNLTLQEVNDLASARVKEKEDRAREEAVPILKSGQEECDKIRAVPDDKVMEAVDLVIERIVNFYGTD